VLWADHAMRLIVYWHHRTLSMVCIDCDNQAIVATNNTNLSWCLHTMHLKQMCEGTMRVVLVYHATRAIVAEDSGGLCTVLVNHSIKFNCGEEQ